MNDLQPHDPPQQAPDTATPHAIILAAGAASRFGSPKQAAKLRDQPLLSLAVTRAGAVSGPHCVSVVLGAHAAELTPLLCRTPATVVINRDWSEGIASSIRAGVAQLPGSCEAVLLMLADQAAVTEADLLRLVAAWRRQPQGIAAAFYGGLAGVPAVFPRADFGALRSLKGDQGARALLRSQAERVTRVPMASAAIDVDTPEDLAVLNSPAT